MSKGLRVLKENSNLAEWSRQVEECRSSGLSVRAWCEQTGIAVSTFHYRQKKVWDMLQQRNQFVEVSLPVNHASKSPLARSFKASVTQEKGQRHGAKGHIKTLTQ